MAGGRAYGENEKRTFFILSHYIGQIARIYIAKRLTHPTYPIIFIYLSSSSVQNREISLIIFVFFNYMAQISLFLYIRAR